MEVLPSPSSNHKAAINSNVGVIDKLSELLQRVQWAPQSPGHLNGQVHSSASMISASPLLHHETRKVSGFALVAGMCEVESIYTRDGRTGWTCSSAGYWA